MFDNSVPFLVLNCYDASEVLFDVSYNSTMCFTDLDMLNLLMLIWFQARANFHTEPVASKKVVKIDLKISLPWSKLVKQPVAMLLFKTTFELCNESLSK